MRTAVVLTNMGQNKKYFKDQKLVFREIEITVLHTVYARIC